MLSDVCTACGGEYSGETREEFLAAALAHYTEAHSEWGLNAVAVENYYDATERLSDATERLDHIGEVEVHRVTPDRIDDVLQLFDRDGFAGKPEWASCYCMEFHRERLHENGLNPWRKNRADLVERLQSGSTTAYLAYADGKPAGWCNASVRSEYPIRRRGGDDDSVGVVACFVIAPPYRRHGLARRLLDAAIDGFREMGLTRAQAHPLLDSDAQDANFLGPLGLYLSAGFEVVKQDERYALVIKEL